MDIKRNCHLVFYEFVRLPESSEGGYINIGHSEVHWNNKGKKLNRGNLYLIFSLYFLFNDTSDCVSLSSGNFLFKKKKITLIF